MKNNQKSKKTNLNLEKYFDNIIIVEGKKDVFSLQALGFQKVYALHSTGIPIRERLLEISKEISKKERVSILTDFDKKGKFLYHLTKQTLQELGVKTNSSLRSLLLKTGISHIEGLHKLLDKEP